MGVFTSEEFKDFACQILMKTIIIAPRGSNGQAEHMGRTTKDALKAIISGDWQAFC